jgi:hypothetical protein
MFDNEKITKETELDTWYGITQDGQKVAITEVDLLEFTSYLSNIANEQEAEKGKQLFECAKTKNYIEMPDGTRLGKTIKDLLENNLLEVANDLVEFAKEQNIKNGHLDFQP